MKTEGSDHHEIGNNTEKTIKIEMVNSHANDSGKIVVAFFLFLFVIAHENNSLSWTNKTNRGPGFL